ncbi:signal peptidase I [candidate division TA06 bacterium]|nr:signal peptidase I [candidate division TA06 bacterium]
MGEVFAWLISIPITVIIIAGVWKTFKKAGKPGWGAIIPIYNAILLLQIAERPIWWILLYLIPIVNFIIGIIVAIDIAKNFGKGTGFGLGLAFFEFIFYPILGFGNAQYQSSS